MYDYLLIAEDEEKIAVLLKDYLKNLFKKINIISRGDQVLESVNKEAPTFMILDVMLPIIDGFVICKKIRQTYDFPILFLTARTSEIDRLIGFEFGADDYVIKPFSLREVVFRVSSILKRVYQKSTDESVKEIIEKNSVYLDPNQHLAKVNSETLKLTPTEFSILEILIKRPNFVFERSFLVRKVMGYEYEGYERNIDAHIKNIRHKIAKITKDEKIESIYGIGYKFLAE